MKKLFILLLAIIGLSSCHPSNSSEFSNFPPGSIIGWGTSKPIPKGWAICNGSNNTPDLNNRFALGTVNGADVGSRVGKLTHTHNFTAKTNGIINLSANGDQYAFNNSDGNRYHHDHSITGQTDTASSIPPATKIIFIMKL